MTLKELCEKSNQENVLFKGQAIDIKKHLAINKVMHKIHKDREAFAFFKNFKGSLQVHVCITNTDGEKEWYPFGVVDANEEEKSKNRKLNIIKEGIS